MSRIVALLLVVVAIISANAHPQQHGAEQECGHNEVFNRCGSQCVDTCTARASPICTLGCVVGCQCKEGYVRNNDNKCVLTRDC